MPQTHAPRAVDGRPALDEPDAGRCLAAIAQRRPKEGWIEAGRLEITLEDGHPTSFVARDENDVVVASAAAPKSGREARERIKALTCQVGGLLVTLDGPAPPSVGPSTSTLVVLKPIATDDDADLAALCALPDARTARDLDRQRRWNDAVERLDERLTTRRWRAWLHDLVDEDERTEGAARMEAREAKADELRSAVAARRGEAATCWFEALLRQ